MVVAGYSVSVCVSPKMAAVTHCPRVCEQGSRWWWSRIHSSYSTSRRLYWSVWPGSLLMSKPMVFNGVKFYEPHTFISNHKPSHLTNCSSYSNAQYFIPVVQAFILNLSYTLACIFTKVTWSFIDGLFSSLYTWLVSNCSNYCFCSTVAYLTPLWSDVET